jgi:hypothetical protein
VIDLLAIMPFELILQGTTDNYQDIVRFARIGRMYKLIKMIRLIRVLKIVKQRSQLLKYLNDFLKIGLGFERLFFFAIIFMLLGHILTCIWVITAQLQDDNANSWINDFNDDKQYEIYITSLYFTITTMTTVGYGDISGGNTLERGISIMIMFIGVSAFSFATGSLSSILSNYD